MLDGRSLQFVFLGRYAGFVTRMAAFTIDRAIVSIMVSIIVWSTEWIVKAFGISQLLFSEGSSWQMSPAVAMGLYLAISLLYDIGFWLLAGQTPGKRVLGVRIVRTDGKRLRFGDALRREIGYVISAILFLGYLWILFDNRRQGFHDKLADTMVVYAWPEAELKGTLVREQVQRLVQQRQNAQKGKEQA